MSLYLPLPAPVHSSAPILENKIISTWLKLDSSLGNNNQTHANVYWKMSSVPLRLIFNAASIIPSIIPIVHCLNNINSSWEHIWNKPFVVLKKTTSTISTSINWSQSQALLGFGKKNRLEFSNISLYWNRPPTPMTLAAHSHFINPQVTLPFPAAMVVGSH